MGTLGLATLAIIALFAFWTWRGYMSAETGKPKPRQKPRKQSPYTLTQGEAVVAFRIGGRYYEQNSDRVMECFSLKGKKQRFAAFTFMNRVAEEKRVLAEFGDAGYIFNKVRIDSGVETCRRGNLRADRFATEEEIAEDIAFEKRRDAIFGK